MDQRWTKCTHTRGRAAIFQAHFSASHRWIDNFQPSRTDFVHGSCSTRSFAAHRTVNRSAHTPTTTRMRVGQCTYIYIWRRTQNSPLLSLSFYLLWYRLCCKNNIPHIVIYRGLNTAKHNRLQRKPQPVMSQQQRATSMIHLAYASLVMCAYPIATVCFRRSQMGHFGY